MKHQSVVASGVIIVKPEDLLSFTRSKGKSNFSFVLQSARALFHQNQQCLKVILWPKMDVEAIKEAAKGLSDILATIDGHMKSEEGQAELCKRPGAIACPSIGIFAQLMTKHHVASMEALDDLFKREAVNFGDEGEEAVEELWRVQDSWDLMLEKVDQSWNNRSSGSVVINAIGMPAPVSADLLDARTGSSVTLEHVLGSSEQPYAHLVLLRHLS